MAASIRYNLLFVGDGGVGKTSFLKRHQTIPTNNAIGFGRSFF